MEIEEKKETNDLVLGHLSTFKHAKRQIYKNNWNALYNPPKPLFHLTVIITNLLVQFLRDLRS